MKSFHFNSKLEDEINNSITQCISYLDKGLDDEKITQTEVSRSPNMTEPFFISSVYIPSYILHSMSFLDNSSIKTKIVSKISNFLQYNMEELGIWRFHGKFDDFPPPDFDDTCCAIASLKKNQIEIETKLLDLLPMYRSDSGMYYTWINDDINKQSSYHTDGGVNINILFCISLFNKRIKEIIDYINLNSSTYEFSQFSIYSISDYSITYMISRAFRDGEIAELGMSIDHIVEFLKQNQKKDGGWGNDLDSVFGFTTLVNAGYKGRELQKALDCLLNRQRGNRMLNSCAFFKAFAPAYYGSTYLTTAIFMESLLKLKNNLFG